jgi:hypothetical protein
MRRQRTTASAPPRPGRGRPPIHQESWSKVSVVLFDRQIAHLDTFGITRRPRRKHPPLNRAAIIRALIDALIDSGMDIGAATSESDLRSRVSRRLGSLR